MGEKVAVRGDEIYCSDSVCRYQWERPPGPYCPDGNISQGANRTFAEGKQIARNGDRAHCCDTTYLNQGVPKVIVEGKQIHLVGMKNNCNGYTRGPGVATVLCGGG